MMLRLPSRMVSSSLVSRARCSLPAAGSLDPLHHSQSSLLQAVSPSRKLCARSAPSLIRCVAHRPSAALLRKPRNAAQMSPSRPMCRVTRLSRAHSRRYQPERPAITTQVIIDPLLGHSSPYEILLRLVLLFLPVCQLTAVILQAVPSDAEIFEGFDAEEVKSSTKTVCMYGSSCSHERYQSVSALCSWCKHRFHLIVHQILQRNSNTCNCILHWQQFT